MYQSTYFDFARLGQLSKSAATYHRSFLSLVAKCPSSPALSAFISEGADAFIAEHVPSLAAWRGLAGMKQLCKSAFGAEDDADVYFASRSRSLMRLGADMMFRVCNHCLTLDLSWETYRADLEREARRLGKRISTLRVQQQVLDGCSNGELIDRICTTFIQENCDGLFIPSVDSLGVRLPVKAIVKQLRSANKLRFVIVDAAQAVGHMPLDETESGVDFVIGGTHKWLGSYFPLGIAIAPNRNSQYFVQNTIYGNLKQPQLTDGLMCFLREVESNGLISNTETVDIASLFSAYGALVDAQIKLKVGLSNAACVSELAISAGWRVVRPVSTMRSAILLVEPPTCVAAGPSRERLQKHLSRYRIVATILDCGLLRLSMPKRPLDPTEEFQLSEFFSSFAPSATSRATTLLAETLRSHAHA